MGVERKELGDAEADLPPDRPYIFGYHPHGLGAMATFATEGTGFSKHFPGISPHLLTLASIVVGGAAESLSAHPGTADLTLRKRLGFIKLAIQHGAGLVPVFSFGENDIWNQLSNEKGTTLYKIQKKFQSAFGFTLPIFHDNFGLLPYRRPIVSVIGRPINVEKHENPTKEQLEEVQKLYIEELMRIWNEYKDVYAKDRRRSYRLI
ncbi:hypothetical protein BOTBODRAFT_52049 [Botryobasidium botryosum FD-172 SS1]|uniref:diacylglycerol O-acyltransferase n=1 Tax=Botryobasidium botryosum (strain FD-172 SS1) TaxID=930990 RepID=A0A067MVS5_BOTB1|nr:hypothetical protein BOTBODRAFT_52049 [Botryobasidium botryosum FD-172 SS1]